MKKLLNIALGVMLMTTSVSFAARYRIHFPTTSPQTVSHSDNLTASDILDMTPLKPLADRGELQQSRVIHTHAATVTRYRQVYQGATVIGGGAAVRQSLGRQARAVYADVAEWRERPELSWSLSQSAAIARAQGELPAGFELRAEVSVKRAVLPVDGLPVACWKVALPAASPLGDFEALVDARDGTILNFEDRLQRLTGQGKVFDPDPKTALQDSTLEDEDDSADAIPEEAYTRVELLDISQDDDDNYILTGPWVDTSPTENRARMEDDEFYFDREDDSFEEVMAYYHIDHQARYYAELGFEDVVPAAIEVDVNGVEEDVSFFSPFTGMITFGSGGVDDAEDADVIIHEHFHSVLNEILPDWRGGHTGLLTEGTCDYFAGDYSLRVAPDFQPTRLFNWDGHNQFWDGRVLDSDVTYDQIDNLDIYEAGEMWSSLLIYCRPDDEELRDEWNEILFTSLAMLEDSATVEDAVWTLVYTVEDLNFDWARVYKNHIQAACRDHKIPFPKDFAPELIHTPIKDSERLEQDIHVIAVSSNANVMVLYLYTNNQDTSYSNLEEVAGSDTFLTVFEGPENPTEYSYSLVALDDDLTWTHLPENAPDSLFSFRIGPDETDPFIIDFDTLTATVFPEGEVNLCVRADDNLGVGSVSVVWLHEDNEPGGVSELTQDASDPLLWSGLFEWDALGELHINYWVLVRDAAEARNSYTSQLQTISLTDSVMIDDFEFENCRWSMDGYERKTGRVGWDGWFLSLSVIRDLQVREEASVELIEQWDFSHTQHAILTWDQQYYFDAGGDDIVGNVQVRLADSDEWETVLSHTGSNDQWERTAVDLTDYCGADAIPLHIRFAYRADRMYEAVDWLIDNVRLVVSGQVSAGSDESTLPDRFAITALYPNPFNSSLRVNYSLPNSSDVNLILYDLTGRPVSRQTIPLQTAGFHTAVIDGAGLASGIYFCRLSSGGAMVSRKIVLLK
ncbi:T9SS type A sorting domain-containing protein [Calditrichota bacterium]